MTEWSINKEAVWSHVPLIMLLFISLWHILSPIVHMWRLWSCCVYGWWYSCIDHTIMLHIDDMIRCSAPWLGLTLPHCCPIIPNLPPPHLPSSPLQPPHPFYTPFKPWSILFTLPLNLTVPLSYIFCEHFPFKPLFPLTPKCPQPQDPPLSVSNPLPKTNCLSQHHTMGR